MYTKGGVDEILAKCNFYETVDGIKEDLENYKQLIYRENEEMAKNALRVLACGYKILENRPSHEEMKNIEQGLIFIRNVWDDRSSKN